MICYCQQQKTFQHKSYISAFTLLTRCKRKHCCPLIWHLYRQNRVRPNVDLPKHQIITMVAPWIFSLKAVAVKQTQESLQSRMLIRLIFYTSPVVLFEGRKWISKYPQERIVYLTFCVTCRICRCFFSHSPETLHMMQKVHGNSGTYPERCRLKHVTSSAVWVGQSSVKKTFLKCST